MMAVDFSPPLAWIPKYLLKTEAKQFLFSRAMFFANSSAKRGGDQLKLASNVHRKETHILNIATYTKQMIVN